MDVETQILLAGARTFVDEPVLAAACRPAGRRVDWERVETEAVFHGVSPLLYFNLARNTSGVVPPLVLRRMGERARANARHSLFLCSELVRLMRRFEAAGIPAVPFKGPVLAAYAYRDVTARVFTDLDVFVPRTSMVAASRVILSEGYVSAYEGGDAAIEHAVGSDGEVAYRQASHYAFYRPDGLSRIDLQWRMAERYFAFALDRKNDWQSRLSELSIGGCRIRTFSPTDTLLVLCVHGSKHRWEKLKWLCDIAELLREHGAKIDWDELARMAAEKRAERMVGLGLVLARDLLDAAVPREALAASAAPVAVSALARDLRKSLFADAHQSPTKLEQAAYFLHLTDRWHERGDFAVRYVKQWIWWAIVPNSADQALVPLPGPLAFLHYLLRPLRLSLKYTTLGLRWLRQKVLARA